jgi:hypothetical protein
LISDREGKRENGEMLNMVKVKNTQLLRLAIISESAFPEGTTPRIIIETNQDHEHCMRNTNGMHPDERGNAATFGVVLPGKKAPIECATPTA